MAEVDYDKLEADLDADIASMLGQNDATATAPDTGTADTTTISAEPDEGTPGGDQDSETQPEPQEETVPKSRYDSAVKAMNRAQQEAAEWRKQVSQLQAENQQLQTQIEQQQRTSEEPTASSEEFDLDVYPELAPLVNRNKALEQKLAKLEAALSGVQSHTAQAQQREQEEAQKRHLDEITAAHPDAQDIAQEEGFADWLREQPPIIQVAIQQGTARDVIHVLDLYKGTKAEPVNRLEAARKAATPNVPKSSSKPASSKPQFTREQIAKMSMQEFMKHEADIDKALASGSIY